MRAARLEKHALQSQTLAMALWAAVLQETRAVMKLFPAIQQMGIPVVQARRMVDVAYPDTLARALAAFTSVPVQQPQLSRQRQ